MHSARPTLLFFFVTARLRLRVECVNVSDVCMWRVSLSACTLNVSLCCRVCIRLGYWLVAEHASMDCVRREVRGVCDCGVVDEQACRSLSPSICGRLFAYLHV